MRARRRLQKWCPNLKLETISPSLECKNQTNIFVNGRPVLSALIVMTIEGTTQFSKNHLHTLDVPCFVERLSSGSYKTRMSWWLKKHMRQSNWIISEGTADNKNVWNQPPTHDASMGLDIYQHENHKNQPFMWVNIPLPWMVWAR